MTDYHRRIRRRGLQQDGLFHLHVTLPSLHYSTLLAEPILHFGVFPDCSIAHHSFDFPRDWIGGLFRKDLEDATAMSKTKIIAAAADCRPWMMNQ
jgi:hypothetical protein